MKKYGYIVIVLIVAIIIGVIVFTNGRKDVTIDVNKLAEEIMQNVKFEDEMNEADSGTIEKLYDISNVVSQKVYISSGATAEEVAIFEFQDKNQVNEAFDKANKRIEEQKESFANYVPKELEKLNEAIVIKKGRYLIVCVTDDFENAQKIIDSYLV